MKAGIRKHQQIRKEKSKALEKEIRLWCDDFYFDISETIDVVDYVLKFLKWNDVLLLSDLIKRCSDYRYYIELLDEAFENYDIETQYFVWNENANRANKTARRS